MDDAELDYATRGGERVAHGAIEPVYDWRCTLSSGGWEMTGERVSNRCFDWAKRTVWQSRVTHG